MTDRYTNAKEQEIVASIFRMSGIECECAVPVKTEGQDTDIDVLGILDNVAVLVECVGTDDFGQKVKKSITDFERNIAEFQNLVNGLSQNFPDFYEQHKSFCKDLTELSSEAELKLGKLIISFNKETRTSVKKIVLACQKKAVSVWTLEEMHYFQRIAECTFEHSGFEILESLGIHPDEITQNDYEPATAPYLAYGKQVRPHLYLLNIIVSVPTLLRRSSIKRLRDSSTVEGYQRLLDEKKLERMREYLLTDLPTYPTNIICKLHEDVRVERLDVQVQVGPQHKPKRAAVQSQMKQHAFLVELPNTFDTFQIIDGQHRLFSFAQTHYSIYRRTKSIAERRKLEKEDAFIDKLSKKSSLVVTAVHSDDPSYKKWADPGRLFYEINTTQTKIDAEDIIDLKERIYPDDPAAHANKLLKRLNGFGALKDKVRVYF